MILVFTHDFVAGLGLQPLMYFVVVENKRLSVSVREVKWDYGFDS